MNLLLDTNLNKNVQIIELASRNDWTSLVQKLALQNQYTTSHTGPFVYPCIMILSNTSILEDFSKTQKLNVEFIYNYKMLNELVKYEIAT